MTEVQSTTLENEPSWLRSKRMRAGIIFDEMRSEKKERIIFPEIHPDKYINPATIESSEEHFPLHEEERSGVVVSFNKEIQKNICSDELKSRGVIIADFTTAVKNHSALLEKYFMNECAQINDGKFVAQHSALADSGLFVYVPKNVNVELPFHSYYFLNQVSVAMFPHLIIVVEEGSSLTLL